MNNEVSFRSTSDGWRGIIADSFTFNFVERLSTVIGNYILMHGGKETFVGYDTRFLSSDFAKRAAQVLNQLGINVLISSKPVPTPIVSFRTNQKGMICGITITASHNPYYYNGVKVRMGYGGPPDEKFTSDIHNSMISLGPSVFSRDINFIQDDPFRDYCQRLRALVDLTALNYHPLKILVDTMHGATSGLLKSVLMGTKTDVSEINSDFDPYFGGVAPEPTESNTHKLKMLVLNGQYDLGIAHDGDGDRIMAVIPGKGYLSPHDVAVVLLWYLVKLKNKTGVIIGSVTMSRRLSKIAEYFRLPYREVPIGFRNACKIMRKEKVLIACEENGGIGFGFYLPERDATLAAALLAEAEVNYKGGVKEILKQVERVAGRSGFCRLNLKLSVSPLVVMETLKREIPRKLGDQIVEKSSEIDGIKFFLESGDWVNIRAAGTEELIRVYAESSNNQRALNVAKEAEEIIRKIERVR